GIANRPKTMFRATMAGMFLGQERPAWVDQPLSPELLRATGYFDSEAVAHERARLARLPWFGPQRLIVDLGLTNVVATHLWHHSYCAGGLCDLPLWGLPPSRLAPPVPVAAGAP